MDGPIIVKRDPIHIPFAGTCVTLARDKSLFPYPNHWRGDYESCLPMIEPRRAGWAPRTDIEFIKPKPEKYSLPDWCFETGPSTRFPCNRGLLFNQWL